MFSSLKWFLFIVLICIGANSNAALIPTAPTFLVGGKTLLTQNMIQLKCRPNGTTNRYSGCRVTGGSSGYTPSGSKLFHIRAVKIETTGTITANTTTTLASCDTDLAIGTTSTPVNPVYFGADSNLSSINFDSGSASFQEQEWDQVIPNTKFFCIDDGTANSVYVVNLFGYEE